MKNPTLVLLTVFYLFFFSSPLQAQDVDMKQLDSLERLLSQEKDPDKLCSLYNSLSFQYIEFGPQKTHDYAQKAFDLAQEHKLTNQKGRAYNNMASYYMIGASPDSAIYYYEKSLEYYREVGNERGIADVLGNMGYYYYYKGDFARSLDLDLQSLRKFEQLNVRIGMANQSVGIASVYMEMKQFDQAIRYDTMAMRLYRELGDQSGQAMVLGNLANIYAEQGDRARAKAALLETVALYEKIGSPIGIGRNLSNLSTIYHDEGNYRAALEALSRAREMFKAANYVIGSCNATGNMGVSYFLSYKNYHHRDSIFHLVPGSRAELLQRAIQLLEESVMLGRQTDDLNSMKTFTKLLSLAYEADGNRAKALEYYKLFTTTKDSLQSVETLAAIEKLTTEREVELKNKQIELDRLAVEKKRNERMYFLIGIGLLFLSVLFVYRNYTNQKRSNVKLASLNHRVSETNHELEFKNAQLSVTLDTLKHTQEQLIETEKQKENALIRGNISQDIHDDISSGLNKICWLAESFMVKAAKAQTPVDMTPLEKINAYARDTVSKLGEIIWSSNPERDNLESLLAYMYKYVENYMEDAPMRWRIEFPNEVPDVPLAPDLRRNLYLVMKEALHNARKYSQAQEILVAFRLVSNACQLEVRDNGVGMTPDLIQGGGEGLNNMRRRMIAIGGQMQFDSVAGKGTVVRAICGIA